MRRILAYTLLAALLVACARESTAPQSAASAHGQWTYNAPHLLAVGDSLPCRLTIQNLSLAQSGTALGGSAAGFNFSCGASTGSTFSGIPVANGRISGDSVAFDIGTENVRSVGKVSGDSMSGITTFRIDLTSRTVVLTGPFTAVRK